MWHLCPRGGGRDETRHQHVSAERLENKGELRRPVDSRAVPGHDELCELWWHQQKNAHRELVDRNEPEKSTEKAAGRHGGVGGDEVVAPLGVLHPERDTRSH